MYRRVLNVDGAPVLVSVTQRATVLDVTLTGEYLSPAIQNTIKPIVERLLGINVGFQSSTRSRPDIRDWANWLRCFEGLSLRVFLRSVRVS